MRKTVTIYGVGERKSGTSKKGNPYDFKEVAIGYQHKNFLGEKVETVGIDTAAIGDMILTPGMVVEVEMFTFNFKTYVTAIYG